MLQSGWAGIQASVDSSLKADAFKPYTVFLQRISKGFAGPKWSRIGLPMQETQETWVRSLAWKIPWKKK